MNTQVSEILELSMAEKIQIVEDIWESISNSPEELPLSEKEKTELDKRLVSYEQNPDDGIEWKTLKHKFIFYVSVIAICFFSAVNIFAQTDSDQDEHISNSKIKTCIVLAETGDTIQSVAERFKLPAIELAKFNGLFLVSRLQKGRKVRVFYTAGRKPEGCVPVEKDKTVVIDENLFGKF